jgi:hypothetical protein
MMLMGWGFTISGSSVLVGISEIKLLTSNGWMAILMLGFCLACYIAWYDALQALPASQLGIFNIEPLVTAAAAFILSESITRLHPRWMHNPCRGYLRINHPLQLRLNQKSQTGTHWNTNKDQ